MKQFLPHSLLLVFMLSAIAMALNIEEKDLTIQACQLADKKASSSSSEKDSFLMSLDAPASPIRLNNVFNARVQTVIVKTEDYLHYLQTYFSQLILCQFQTIKLIYASLYSQKKKNGYYIYTLQKLLI